MYVEKCIWKLSSERGRLYQLPMYCLLDSNLPFTALLVIMELDSVNVSPLSVGILA